MGQVFGQRVTANNNLYKSIGVQCTEIVIITGFGGPGGGGGRLQTWHGIGTSPGIRAVGTMFSFPWGSLPGSKRSTSSRIPSSVFARRMIHVVIA